MADVKRRFPDASPGIVFCILKLEQNADLRLKDFKAEAELHGIRLSGRSFHSARVALGLEAAKVRQPRTTATETVADAGAESGAETVEAQPAPRRVVRRPTPRAPSARPLDGEESPAIMALREFEARNSAEVERLRSVIREVVAIIDAALDE